MITKRNCYCDRVVAIFVAFFAEKNKWKMSHENKTRGKWTNNQQKTNKELKIENEKIDGKTNEKIKTKIILCWSISSIWNIWKKWSVFFFVYLFISINLMFFVFCFLVSVVVKIKNMREVSLCGAHGNNAYDL